MPTFREMFAHNTWYVAGWSHELGKKPMYRKLMNEHVVMYRDSQGKPHALNAECPHRGANLAHGKITGDNLTCPFHGWEFNCEGTCVRIPSQPPSHKIPASARARRFPIREEDGVMWIWPGERTEDLPELPANPYWKVPGHRRTYVPAQHNRTSFLASLENAIDNAHLQFVHLRTAYAPKLVKPQLITMDADGRGFTARYDPSAGPEWDEQIPLPGLEALMIGIAGLGEKNEYHFGYRFPGQFFHHFLFPDGKMFCAVGNTTPADEDHTWFFTDSVRTKGMNVFADFAHWRFNVQLNKEDQVATQSLISLGPGGRSKPVSVLADKPAMTFRKIYARLTREEGRRAPWDQDEDAPTQQERAPALAETN